MTVTSALSERWKKLVSEEDFTPVIPVPKRYEVLDLNNGYKPDLIKELPFAVGKYDELRQNMYVSEHFEGVRNIHIGIDLWCKAGTPIYAFADGVIFGATYIAKPLDYGATIITEHKIADITYYALFGHVSLESTKKWKSGEEFKQGEVLTHVGHENENGGWAPHLHFQLSLKKPETIDMPGVVAKENRSEARSIYPDPQYILGKLYD